MIDTLVERATINKNREILVEIRVNLRAILDQDAASTMPSRAYIEKGEIYTRIPDIYRAGQILVVL
jgi:hypothetical protein